MSCLIKFLKGKCECTQVGLLILRILPGYFLLANHGWGKITHPEKWDGLGSAVTKYVGVIDFLNPMFGFLGAFSESICAGLVLIGLFTQPAAALVVGTMFFAAMYHITGTGNPESALIYMSIFAAIATAGPGKYSIDKIFLSKAED
ncbi:MAG: DoxX family protein [Candidatus Marinimicrobia bacterium]|jgi:putative oxidoreductase|nr:DoxX family protein [Candidatus Neomarinimicrobiota bacterium]MBT3947049.1 DoxX family protein [Candidatus Neomarinimicrobiota bacterium]MBT4064981.1 DoxX family protein [Candidatus Neomarinimicrobiota bacterium]MBT4307041.1 DoxX family protein [Candidatus Neomarinimicrobiota bacterium]MBT4453677.1 DoxX family protein [Candidatus Neomarinimicrobiota bacterium]